jgi:hypothetical protein
MFFRFLLSVILIQFYPALQTNKMSPPTSCKKCDANLSVHSMSRHMAIQHSDGKAPECEECHKRFSSNSRLEAHVQLVHEENVEKTFICDECAKPFKTKEYLRNHKRTKHKKNQGYCGLCNKGFDSTQQLTLHKNKVHVGIIKCNECDKQYKSIASMKLHKKMKHEEAAPAPEDPLLEEIDNPMMDMGEEDMFAEYFLV